MHDSQKSSLGTISSWIFAKNEEEEAWEDVENAIKNIPQGFSPYLHHIGKKFVVLRKGNEKREASEYEGLYETSQISDVLQLHPRRILDHTAWSYSELFHSKQNTLINTSLATPGALVHHLQRLTACKIQNGCQWAPKLTTGSGKQVYLFLAASVIFR